MEIILGPQPLILNDAPTGKELSRQFLQDFAEHYHAEGKGIFGIMYARRPGAIGQVLKIEIGKPHDFARPSSKDEALDQLERRAGPAARKMVEKFLDQVAKAEAEYLEQPDTATSFKDAASRRR